MAGVRKPRNRRESREMGSLATNCLAIHAAPSIIDASGGPVLAWEEGLPPKHEEVAPMWRPPSHWTAIQQEQADRDLCLSYLRSRLSREDWTSS